MWIRCRERLCCWFSVFFPFFLFYFFTRSSSVRLLLLLLCIPSALFSSSCSALFFFSTSRRTKVTRNYMRGNAKCVIRVGEKTHYGLYDPWPASVALPLLHSIRCISLVSQCVTQNWEPFAQYQTNEPTNTRNKNKIKLKNQRDSSSMSNHIHQQHTYT